MPASTQPIRGTQTKPPQQRELQTASTTVPHSTAMTAATSATAVSTDLTDDFLASIDTAADACRMTLNKHASNTAYAIALARGIRQLQSLFTDQVMQEILPLMNCELGFLTDKDPSKPQKGKDGNYYNPEPYSKDIVRDCFIVATLKGARPVGNEFNIISGRVYLAKNFFKRMLLEHQGFTEFEPAFGIPKVSDGGAIVPCKATSKLRGQPRSFEAQIAVRLNVGMGADAAVGKAERKFYARIYNILTGTKNDEADVDLTLSGDNTIDSTATFVSDTMDAEAAHEAAESSQEPPADIAAAELAADELANEILGMLDQADTIEALDAVQRKVRENEAVLKAIRVSALKNQLADQYDALAARKNGGGPA